MRRLRRGGRGGAHGAQVRERSLFTLGVGRILAVFFVIFARNRFLWPELGLLGRVGEMASPGSEASALVAGCVCFWRRE